MNRKIMRAAAGANIVAGCLLLQGCAIFGGKSQQSVTQTPENLPPVEVQPIESVVPPIAVAPSVVELPVVQATTPYTIQKGDTISAVAYKYGMRWQDVVAVNPGISPTQLRVGQVIQLPGTVDTGNVRYVPVTTKAKPTPPKVTAPKSTVSKSAPVAANGTDTTYTVKAGDSLSVIAMRHGIKTAALRDANNIKGDKIIVGQKLKVPGAVKKPAGVTVQSPKASPTKLTAPVTTTTKPMVEDKPVVENKPVVTTPVKAVVAPPPVVKEEVEVPLKESDKVVDDDGNTYTVKENEDLYAVAIRWGVSPSDLKALNNLTSSDLKAGTVLRIPKTVQ